MRRWLRWGGRLVRALVGVVLLVLVLRRSTLALNEPFQRVAAVVREDLFDYVGWEARALLAKANGAAYGLAPYLTEAARADMVRAYFDDLTAARGLELQLETQTAAGAPAADLAQLAAERDTRRASLAARQTLVESILQSQVSAVLADEGFAIGGQVVPPVAMRFTQGTGILVTSPRDRIELQYAYTLNPLPLEQRIAYEDAITAANPDVSALIAPLGGMALYPAMLVENVDLAFMVETFAHEWLHHYLVAFPLGYTYYLDQTGGSEARAINETTAVLFGRAVAGRVLARYYPELAVPQVRAPALTFGRFRVASRARQTGFDYATEMNTTRLGVDARLAVGDVAGAEAYMEARRQLFVANGYGIRRLNQAWFAFYGGYQVASYSASGSDPTGAAVQQVYDASASLLHFVAAMRGITTRAALLTLAG